MTSKSVKLAKPMESKCPLNCSFYSFLKKKIKSKEAKMVLLNTRDRTDSRSPDDLTTPALWLQCRCFYYSFSYYKAVARHCRIKPQRVLSNIGIIFLMLVGHVFGSYH